MTQEVEDLLVPLVTDTDISMEASGFAALALGLVFTSTCKEDIVSAILQALMCRSELDLQVGANNMCASIGHINMCIMYIL